MMCPGFLIDESEGELDLRVPESVVPFSDLDSSRQMSILNKWMKIIQEMKRLD
jgi:hypothetical protein